MDRFDPFVKYADVYGDIINWEKDPMNKPQNQNKYFFSDGKTYYEQICKMLRLMSVFKEAFNQIYSNEDEISEAWENFVNNLSASVVEGSEPDVTLTWTDDSVNFEFTMVPGVPGEQGVGITSISFNSDYTMTITLSDGNTYTSMSLKGETGPQGPQGETGSGLQILDVYATLADLQSAHPTGQPGDAYQVGSAGNYILYIWSSSQSAWVQAGTLGTVSPYTSAPLMDGTASAGSQNLYARGDHVHPSDTSRASKEELDALIKTSQSLIDQSFTYRESPAIQDGLARIDKIKGNTLGWNQLVENGNFADASGWEIFYPAEASISVNSNVLTETISASTLALGSAYRIGLRKRDVFSDATHKYFCSFTVTPSFATTMRIEIGGSESHLSGTVNANTRTKISFIAIASANNKNLVIYPYSGVTGNISGQTLKYENVMLIDLTAMFGAGKEPTTVEEFSSLFSFPYYDYNAGSLLSFNGSGLKITGKNLFNGAESYTRDSAGYYIREGETNNPLPLKLAKGTYTISIKSTVGGTSQLELFSGGTASSDRIIGPYVSLVVGVKTYTFTIDKPCDYIRLYGNFIGTISDIQIESGSTATSYEPYAESTLSLPVSAYFPSGMKSAGNAYDELTSAKAITRIGAVDLGSLTWTKVGAISMFYAPYNTDGIFHSGNDLPNIKTSIYSVCSATTMYNNRNGIVTDDVITVNAPFLSSTEQRIIIADTSYNDANALKTALSGVYLYYELATPTETAVDLDLDFMAYEDGTEQLLPVNGSVPTTSPIIVDMTYLSIDDAMEYILEKLSNVPLNTQQRLEALEDDVADLQTDVGTLQTNVSGLQTSVGNINTNIGQLSSTVAGHTASISDIQSDITDLNTDLDDLGDTVTDNTSRISTLETGLSNTDGQVQNLATSVSGLDSTVTAQGTTVTALDSIIQDISNNPVSASLGQHELGLVAAYVDATLPANTGTMVTIPKPTIFPSNYTPLFIIGMTTGSYNVSICSIPYGFGNNDSVTCRVWNHGSQQTTQITVYILCMRQRQSQ